MQNNTTIYNSEMRGASLPFFNVYREVFNKTFKHVKRSTFALRVKMDYVSIDDIIQKFCENRTNTLYTNTYREYNKKGYLDSFDYAYLFLDNDIGIAIIQHNYTEPFIELMITYENHSMANTCNELFDELFESLSVFRLETRPAGRVNFICQSASGLYLRELILKNESSFDLENHYNDDFKEISEKIMKSLNSENSKGIVLLHGKHGTGKTSYLRYLINSLNKNIIYVSPDMSHRVSEPAFLTFLLKHPNSILIIEDAENVIKSRQAGENQAVSNLLNITDGILGDGLNFQIICTFNTGFDNIDPALKRKGRMIAQYEFNDLNEEKTSRLVKSIHGNDAKPENPKMSLAEIFNMADDNYNVEKKKNAIGFMASI